MMNYAREFQAGALLALLAFGAMGCEGAVGKEKDKENGAGGEGGVADAAVNEAGEPIAIEDGAVVVVGSGDGSVALADASASFIPVATGTVLTTPPANTNLPELPRLSSVRATAIGDSVAIAFDPVEQAVDYRVYELPAASAVTTASDGRVTIRDAVYRCAGNRQTVSTTGNSITVVVDGNVEGFARSTADATLGYVFQEPGTGRVPVYALGEYRKDGDNDCFTQRWTASRAKQYVTTEAARDALLKQGFRDDGIAFYAPATASGATKQVFTSSSSTARLYFASSAEQSARSGETPAFLALAAQTAEAVPLMRAFYRKGCGARYSHDELVAGRPRFEVITKQGDRLPLSNLHWAGLKEATTLVIEALDAGCPYQGFIAPKSVGAHSNSLQAYEQWFTPDAIQAASPSHELFINGQFDGNPTPKPIARSFVRIAPAPAPELDWQHGYKASDDFGSFASTSCGTSNCFMTYREVASAADVVFYSIEEDRWTHRQMFGEWWVAYADWAATTNGKYRLTAKTKADMAADSFLYVSMDVDGFSTARRYPQILISDRDIPVQANLPEGNTLVLQTFADWPNTYELQICDHRNWDVNDQCPRFDFWQQRNRADATEITRLAPSMEVGEQVGMDHTMRFEIYTSTKRAYLFLNGKPHGCADLPNAGVPAGAVTVTFGDVLYHAADDKTFDYTKRHRQGDTIRHYDNLGFKSHVPPPVWDESRFPCTPHLFDE